jgi:hypothetical protein
MGNTLHEQVTLNGRTYFRDSVGYRVALEAEVERLQRIVDKLPLGAILDCCERIKHAEQRAMAVDGDVEKTSRVMNESDLERCLRVLWKCCLYEIAKAQKAEIERLRLVLILAHSAIVAAVATEDGMDGEDGLVVLRSIERVIPLLQIEAAAAKAAKEE